MILIRKIRFLAVILLFLTLFYCSDKICGASVFDEEDFLVGTLWRKAEIALKEKRPKIALVLGNGARGISYIGVLRVLQEK